MFLFLLQVVRRFLAIYGMDAPDAVRMTTGRDARATARRIKISGASIIEMQMILAIDRGWGVQS